MSWEEDLLQGITPSILTVQYNAWHYRNETEAWAGLAVEITKELEATMTVAHKLRTSWIYNWRNRRNSICFGVILPFVLALVVAIWFSTIVWFILDTGKDNDIKKFKYAGLPASMIVAAWGVGKSVISFVKPVSLQVVDYLCLPDHSQKLGYHQKVIDDINFLKEHLCYKRVRKWEVFAFIWCCITWGWNDNYVAGTKIYKMPPAYGNKLRMIVFVDDLDRCEENVILQVLSAVNPVLATCEINVILSMENKMIQRAILRKYGNNNSKDNKELAEKYLRKIVQLPLHLPDPSDSESSDFLERQLGMWDSIQGSIDPAAEIEQTTAHRRRKESPKFEIIPPAPEKFKRGREGEEYFAHSGAKLKRDPTNSGSGFEDATTEANGTTNNEQPVDEKRAGFRAEDSGVEEGAAVILEMTTDIEHPIKRNKQEEKNEKAAERTSTIAQICSYGCALLYPCNVLPHNTHSRVEETTTEINETTRIEQKIEGNEQGDQQQREGSKGKRLMDDLSSIMSALLIPRYTPGERSAFRFLHSRSTRSRKLPREWKCFMAYHRLAWNILFLTPDCIRVEGWQVQLIAWIFVCWEWRDLITLLIKNWNKLDVLRNWKGEEGPSLREVVEHYIDEALPAEKKSSTKEKDDSTKLQEETLATISNEEDTGDDYLRQILKEQEEMREALTKVLKEQEEMREILMRVPKEQEEMKEIRNMLEMVKEKVFKDDEDNKEESSLQQGEEDMEMESSVQQYTTAEEREEWIKLRDTLRLYNVSMNGIQAFQKFRFYCEPSYLPWPLPKLV